MHKSNADETATSPNEEDLGLQVCVALTIVDEIWGAVREGPVKQPV
jgi:hypothetical protein